MDVKESLDEHIPDLPCIGPVSAEEAVRMASSQTLLCSATFILNPFPLFTYAFTLYSAIRNIARESVALLALLEMIRQRFELVTEFGTDLHLVDSNSARLDYVLVSHFIEPVCVARRAEEVRTVRYGARETDI